MLGDPLLVDETEGDVDGEDVDDGKEDAVIEGDPLGDRVPEPDDEDDALGDSLLVA